MPNFDQRIAASVGNRPAPNRIGDQIVIIDLLEAISTENGGATTRLPPAVPGGQADFRLVNAILNFQLRMVSNGLMPGRKADGRVDPNGTTLGLMNKFANFNGTPRVIDLPLPPDDPLPPPIPPKTAGGGFLQSLFGKMTPRPTNLKIGGTGAISLSITTIGAVTGFINVQDARQPGPNVALNMLGVGLSLGPFPFGVEVAPASFPSQSSQIHAGPRTTSTTIDRSELLGPTLLIGASTGLGFGFNSTAILFNIGANRSLSTLPLDILNSLNPNPAISFLTDSFNSCRAWASTAGAFAGASVGVSLIEVKLFKDNLF